jgi:hypothetical protein
MRFDAVAVKVPASIYINEQLRAGGESDDILRELHLPHRQLKDVFVSFSETSQSLAALAASRAWRMIRAVLGAPRNSPKPPGP